MGFFNFSKSKEGSEYTSFWKSIETEEQLNAAIQESYNKRIAIFKHSTRCGISSRVKSNFEKEIGEHPTEVVLYYLDLLAHRELSNRITQDFDVSHQSPQLIVLENGVVLNHASHSSISYQQLK
ncbi:MAG: bacillithiol system redox-active protein YtxJ [Bacteroidetes bacterium]|nr:bacillithiol system redox-active protein YtxJ [Bacteroidota bacterium]